MSEMIDSRLKTEKVAVAFGGSSAEREISLLSGKAVLNALIKSGVQAIPFDPKTNSLNWLKQENVDVVWNALHGRGGEDGTLQAALSYLNIRCTGSDVASSALAMDKWRSKMIWKAMGLPVANHQLINGQDQLDDSELRRIFAKLGPVLFVKPSREGSSVGMSKVDGIDSLREALSFAEKYDSDVLVESFIQGSEYTVAILGDDILPSIRMETPREFYDYEAKYQSTDTRYFCPSGLSDTDEKALKELALHAFKALGCSGWGRVDFIYDERSQTFKLLEVNTVPGMTESSLVPKSAAQAGINFEELTTEILKLTYE